MVSREQPSSRQVRFWIAEYSLPRYSRESLHRIILYVMVLLMCRARDRLEAACIARAHPDPEKASAAQDLHQTLRVQMYTRMHVLNTYDMYVRADGKTCRQNDCLTAVMYCRENYSHLHSCRWL